MENPGGRTTKAQDSIKTSYKYRRNTSLSSQYSSTGMVSIMQRRGRKSQKLIGRLEWKKPTAVVCTLNVPRKGPEGLVMKPWYYLPV